MSSPSVVRATPAKAKSRKAKSEGTRPHEANTAATLAANGTRYQVQAQLVFKDGDNAGKPIGGARYEVLDPSGKRVAEGRTGFDGMLVRPVPGPGDYTVKVYTD